MAENHEEIMMEMIEIVVNANSYEGIHYIDKVVELERMEEKETETGMKTKEG